MNRKKSFFIDCIKVIASQFVLFGHCFAFFKLSIFKDQTYFPYIQNIGVILLFAISGFLFSYTSRRYGGVEHFKKYYINRFIRIKIPYIMSMVIISFLSVITILINKESYRYYNAFNFRTAIMNILMFQNHPIFLALDKIFSTNIAVTCFASARPFWTLSIEWWYYMFFGYFWFSVKNKSKIHFGSIILLGFFSVVPLYCLLDGNCLTFVWLGGVMIENLHEKIVIKSKNIMRLILIVLFSIMILNAFLLRDAYGRNFQVSLILTLLAMFVVLKDDDTKACNENNIINKCIKNMASYSYSLYLLHYSIIDFIYCMNIPNSSGANWVKLILSVVISNIMAFYFSQVFERKTSRISQVCYMKMRQILKIDEVEEA